jgi:hypothetical protein
MAHAGNAVSRPAEVGEGACEVLSDPVYADIVTYGIGAHIEIMSLDV